MSWLIQFANRLIVKVYMEHIKKELQSLANFALRNDLLNCVFQCLCLSVCMLSCVFVIHLVG